MILLDHDSEKVAKLDKLVAKELGFAETKPEIGRAKEQAESFLNEAISPFLAQYKDLALPPSEANV